MSVYYPPIILIIWLSIKFQLRNSFLLELWSHCSIVFLFPVFLFRCLNCYFVTIFFPLWKCTGSSLYYSILKFQNYLLYHGYILPGTLYQWNCLFFSSGKLSWFLLLIFLSFLFLEFLLGYWPSLTGLLILNLFFPPLFCFSFCFLFCISLEDILNFIFQAFYFCFHIFNFKSSVCVCIYVYTLYSIIILKSIVSCFVDIISSPCMVFPPFFKLFFFPTSKESF